MYDNKKLDNINFILSKREILEIEKEKSLYEESRAASIGALKIVQKHRGWVSNNAIYAIAKVLNIPPSDLEGVATFYSQIFRQPVGRHIVRYCDSVVCYINGYYNIQSTLENHLNIKSGQITSDNKFTLLPTSCLGNCDKGPTIMIDEDIYSYLRPEMITSLLEKYK